MYCLEFDDYINYKIYINIDSDDYKFIEDYHEGLAATKHNNGVCGYIDENGYETLLTKYNVVGDFQNGMALVQNRQGLYGFINRKLKEVIPCEYLFAINFKYEYTVVKNQFLNLIINKNGQIIKSIEDDINFQNISKVLYENKLITKKQYKESFNNKLVEQKSDVIKKVNLMPLMNLKTYSYHNDKGEKIIPYYNIENRDFNNDLIIIRVDKNDIRIFNKKGKQIKIYSCIEASLKNKKELSQLLKKFSYKSYKVEENYHVSTLRFNDSIYNIYGKNADELLRNKIITLNEIKNSIEDQDTINLIEYKIKTLGS